MQIYYYYQLLYLLEMEVYVYENNFLLAEYVSFYPKQKRKKQLC